MFPKHWGMDEVFLAAVVVFVGVPYLLYVAYLLTPNQRKRFWENRKRKAIEKARGPLIALTYFDVFASRICPQCGADGKLASSETSPGHAVLGCTGCGFAIPVHATARFGERELASRGVRMEKTARGVRLAFIPGKRRTA